MAQAVMADATFVAERANLSFVRDSDAAAAAATRSRDAAGQSDAATGGTARTLRIPRRPVWDDAMTAEELHRAEKDAFLEWRRQVAAAEIEHGGGVGAASAGVAAVTPFEKNLEVRGMTAARPARIPMDVARPQLCVAQTIGLPWM